MALPRKQIRAFLRQLPRCCYDARRRAKTRHPNRIAAHEALARIRQQNSRIADQLNIYQCPVCCYWHLGHPPQPK